MGQGQPTPREAPPPRSQSKAHQLLGLHDDRPVESQDLVAEVESYLNDRSTSTSSLHFWQASH
jgi:hypothetical protein